MVVRVGERESLRTHRDGLAATMKGMVLMGRVNPGGSGKTTRKTTRDWQGGGWHAIQQGKRPGQLGTAFPHPLQVVGLAELVHARPRHLAFPVRRKGRQDHVPSLH